MNITIVITLEANVIESVTNQDNDIVDNLIQGIESGATLNQSTHIIAIDDWRLEWMSTVNDGDRIEVETNWSWIMQSMKKLKECYWKEIDNNKDKK